MVFKEYKAGNLAAIDVAALEAFPNYLESISFNEGLDLLSRTAWPCRLVETDGGEFVGFVMPIIPPEFFIDMKKPSGAVDRVAAEMQHLLNEQDFLARRGIALSDKHRYQLLSAVAETLSMLHRHNLVVGDLSPKNLLFSLTDECAVFFIDCDAMRLSGRSVIPQLETPDWDVAAMNPGEELATVESDSYKFGLLALRLWVGDQTTRDPTNLPTSLPREVRELVIAALSADPASRPAAGEWIGDLRAAARTASTQPPRQKPPTASGPVVAGPRTYRTGGPVLAGLLPTPTPTPTPTRYRRRRKRGVLLAAILVGVVVVGFAVLSGRTPDTAATRSTVSSPPKVTTRQVADATPISPDTTNRQIQAMSIGQCWNGTWSWNAADDSYIVVGEEPAVVACDSPTATQRLEMVADDCRGTQEWLNLTERSLIDGQAHCLVLVPQEAQCLPARLDGGRLGYSGIPVRCDSAASSRFPALIRLKQRLDSDDETCNTEDGDYFIWWDLLATGFCYNILR